MRCCTCEHSAHLDKDTKTPNGNPGHKYKQNFFDSFLVNVKTPYGTFTVCKDCATDCFAS